MANARTSSRDKQPITPIKSTDAKPSIPKEAAAAFAKVEREIEALDPNDLEPVNIDIPRAVALAIGAAPHLHAMRPQILSELPHFPIRSLDEIGTYAMAAWFAHLLALPETTDKPLNVLLDEGTPLRAGLLVGADALVAKGYFDRKAVEAIREGRGNIDTANDLVSLAALYTSRWDKISHKTAVELSEVQRAAELGPQILIALGARDQPGVKAPDAADPVQRRQRAFTLFVRTYEECRRAVSYLRWYEGDADEIAPSLWTKRSRKAAAEPAAEPADAPLPAEPPAPAPAAPAIDK